ncbi:MAG: hypothetical protein WA766_02730, partial [Candidatus Acidiferrales bacterium]
RDSLLEITADTDLRDEFDELEEWGPQFNLTGGSTTPPAVQEYPFANLVPTGDYNISTLDVLLWTDYPTNTNRIRLVNTSYQDADRTTTFTGQPVKWYRFTDTIGFSPTPNLNYLVQARIYKQHPINDANLNATVILINRDWNEVLIWAAVQRGFMELKQYQTAAGINTLLHGDPRYPGAPGLINARKKRRTKENWRESKSLKPRYRPYSSHGRY